MTDPTPNFRALCAELLQTADILLENGESSADPGERLVRIVHLEALEDCAERARAALAAPPPEISEAEALAEWLYKRGQGMDLGTRDWYFRTSVVLKELAAVNAALATPPPEPVDPSQISDGYHTFEELYEHRHALTLSLMKARPDLFWYSRRHNDGELCFGDGSWFILGAELPVAGGITYHLPMRLWDAATLTGATELEIGREWDGHTATDVANRLMAWAPTPPPEPPTDEELLALKEKLWYKYKTIPYQWEEFMYGDAFESALSDYRAILKRWGE